ncbi:IseA DL-endopeptidase inhibitor family protein [Brevibacillus humidisoli]|uniref:IseA DL-endopeptidase inhibitor family protein n=1 Tax=Brevibacillus humidisoli TaxID=2895522 RepID=UPI001E46B8CC|nr:IseA DL-endopeptidase inhibitor family protein [Brevibacillus humidisoli]UFJ41284.1 IseA DL-endopeptidase inhibitor family protein [Brevibacillus humidisoli]
MIKRNNKWLIAFCLSLALVGCSQSGEPETSATSDQTDPPMQQRVDAEPTAAEGSNAAAEHDNTGNAAAGAEEGNTGDVSAAENSVPADMDEQAAVKLAAEAIRRYFHVSSGGDYSHLEGERLQGFLIGDQHYRYMGQDLDTREKLIRYLEQGYTIEAIETFIQQAKIVEHEGRLAQPDADYGSLLEWQNAQARLIAEEDNIKRFELTIPFGEGEHRDTETTMVEMKKIDGVGWRVNTTPHDLR